MTPTTASNHASSGIAWLCLGWLLLGTSPSHAAPATPASCKALFAQKAYLPLATCFETLSRQLGAAEKLTTAGRYKKGQYLRNAALALFQSIKQAPNQATSRRLRALKLLERYKIKGLCQNKTRCDWAQAQILRLNKALGLTRTHFVTHHKEATITLQQGQRTQQGKGDWSPKLLPGSYTLIVAYPDQQPIMRTIQVLSGQTKRYTFTPPNGGPKATRRRPPKPKPPKRRSTRRAPPQRYPDTFKRDRVALRKKRHQRAQRKRRTGMYVGYIGGGALAALGIFAIVTGAVVWSGAKAEWEKDTTPQSEEERLQKQRTGGVALLGAGWLAVAAGVGLGIMGLVFHARYNAKEKAFRLPPPKEPRAQLMYQTGWTP